MSPAQTQRSSLIVPRSSLGTTWAILTGEYPPQIGGVSDYTQTIARHLADAGDIVHVFTATGGTTTSSANVTLHPLHDHFGRAGLRWLDSQLRELPRPLRVLVQYVPHAFGHRAMNVRFALWLWHRRRHYEIDVMFHEVAFGFDRGQPLRHHLLAAVQLPMAGLAARAARRIFVSIPAWEPRLRRFVGKRKPITWLPVPSSIESSPDPACARAVRERIGVQPDELLLGHFGTYGSTITNLLSSIMTRLASERTEVAHRWLLIGKGSDDFCRKMAERSPALTRSLVATGALPRDQIAAHLVACDLLVQPYPDGISTRRSSAMAGLGLGKPMVTCEGRLSEPIWRESGGVALASAPSADEMAAKVDVLLESAPARAALGQRARSLYAARFDIDNLITALRTGPMHSLAGSPLPSVSRMHSVRPTDKQTESFS
jgi:glycosyltransferase involved in cell wall biosynthesis